MRQEGTKEEDKALSQSKELVEHMDRLTEQNSGLRLNCLILTFYILESK